MNWKTGWVFLVLAATMAPAAVIAADSGHTAVVCGISFRGPDRQLDLHGLQELPAHLRDVVERHIGERVGSKNASALIFDRGQLKNLDSPASGDKPKEPLARRLYNLIYSFRLAPDQSVTACILLEPDGDLVQGLSLPAWGQGAAAPVLVTLAEAKAIASKHGMSNSREAELRYFPDTGTLEWLFSKSTGEDGPSVWGTTLHIPAQDPAGIHWSKWEAIR